MTRPFALFGVFAALLCGIFGTALLVSPAEGAAAPEIEQLAAPALGLPEDPSLRVRLLAPAAPALDAAAQPPELAVGTRLRIPRLQIDVAIEPGDSARDIAAQATPTFAAYLLPGSAVPGTEGNSYIYAHARPGLFLSLWNTRLGDAITVTAPSGEVLRYVVTEIHPRVAPTELRYITPADDERITLQTSTGTWALSPRFVVVAVPAR